MMSRFLERPWKNCQAHTNMKMRNKFWICEQQEEIHHEGINKLVLHMRWMVCKESKLLDICLVQGWTYSLKSNERLIEYILIWTCRAFLNLWTTWRETSWNHKQISGAYAMHGLQGFVIVEYIFGTMMSIFVENSWKTCQAQDEMDCRTLWGLWTRRRDITWNHQKIVLLVGWMFSEESSFWKRCLGNIRRICLKVAKYSPSTE